MSNYIIVKDRGNKILSQNMRLLLLVLLSAFIFLIIGICVSSCSDSGQSTPTALTQSKATSLLFLQISLRREQLASPTKERLAQMQSQGMNTSNLNIQRIFIYLKQPLTPAQTGELQALGITVYLNSWIPPAGNNPDGFYLADLPVDKLDALAAKYYVVRLDTAEKQLHPLSDLSKGG
jgi:hypothetical protein